MLLVALCGCQDEAASPAAAVGSVDSTSPSSDFITPSAPIYYSDAASPSVDELAAATTYRCTRAEVALPGLYRTRRITYGEDWTAPVKTETQSEGIITTHYSVKASKIEEVEFFADASALKDELGGLEPVTDIGEWVAPPQVGLAIRIYEDSRLVLGFQGREPGIAGIPVGVFGKDHLLKSLHAAGYPDGHADEVAYADRRPGTLELAFTDFSDNIYARTAIVRLPDTASAGPAPSLLVSKCGDGSLLFWSAIRRSASNP